MNLNDKVHIDPSVILNVLKKSGTSLNVKSVENNVVVGGEVVITSRFDVAGQILCERGDDTRDMRVVQFDSRNTPFFIPQEDKEARVNWEVLYPRAHWPIYALTRANNLYYTDFSDWLNASQVGTGLCDNTHQIIDVSNWDAEVAKGEYVRLTARHGTVSMYGVTAEAWLGSMASARPVIRPLFICIY